jgi:hypothetical protein
MGEKIDVYRVLAGIPEGKKDLGTPVHRWEDNIKMYLKEIGSWAMDGIHLAQDRNKWRAFMNMAMNVWIP